MKFTLSAIFVIVLVGICLYQSNPVDLSQLNIVATVNYAAAHQLNSIAAGLSR